MQLKHALATTSVLALLMAGPVMAQTPPQPGASQPAANQPAAKSGGADITVQQPAPTVTVEQPPPQVTVTTPEPQVQVQTGEPQVRVVPPGEGVGTTAPAAPAPAPGAAMTAPAPGMFPMATDTERLIGRDVLGADGSRVGDLENLLIDTNGRVRAAIIEFGGFLGIGTNKVAVPWDQLQITDDRIATNLTREQVRAMPRWERDRGTGDFADYRPHR
jgi:sporulation protein YlmC with PRC-barrel domain